MWYITYELYRIFHGISVPEYDQIFKKSSSPINSTVNVLKIAVLNCIIRKDKIQESPVVPMII